jgi:hypothetical protein
MLLGVEMAKISPQSPKSEFGAQNQYGCVIYPLIRNLIFIKKIYVLGVEKAKISLQSPKRNLCSKICMVM